MIVMAVVPSCVLSGPVEHCRGGTNSGRQPLQPGSPGCVSIVLLRWPTVNGPEHARSVTVFHNR